MPLSRLQSSVSLQILLAFALVVAAALTGFAASLHATRLMAQDAERINIAGSLRMLSTRAALAYYSSYAEGRTDDIVDVLSILKPRLASPVLDEGSQESRLRLRLIRDRWKNAEAKFLALQEDPEHIRRLSRQLVDEIDAFVSSAQRDSEEKLSEMRMTQLLALSTVLLTSAMMVWLIRRRVQTPLSGLTEAHQRVRQGDLSTRMTWKINDEFGQLADSFNDMTQQLQKLYSSLEDEVARQTQALNLRNEGLSALVEASQALHGSTLDTASLRQALNQVRLATQAEALGVYLAESDAPRRYCLVQTDSAAIKRGLSTEEVARITQPEPEHFGLQVVLPLSVTDGHLGYLAALFKAPPEAWQHQLVTMFARQITQALLEQHDYERKTRAALQEERTAIGRDLHDSLAQSLAYLKILLTKSQRLLEMERKEELARTLREAREGLNAGYNQLRELLTTFRLQINEPGLEQALKGACTEFASRGENLEVKLEWMVDDCVLDANDEIHLLQIVREALTNAVKHADATLVTVRLSRINDAQLDLVIEDNGRGLPEASSPLHHHGLRIMRERAEALPEGEFKLSSPPENRSQGTQVRVTFASQRESMSNTKVIPHVIQ
ncbi:MAG: HAMP domain-containing protein [Gammaproteobacteria bacterium]|nr:MAG: HAMP domain-containing protein [Gammaproteobacteria bacterium]